MISDPIIQDAAPLHIRYLPSEFVDREDEKQQLQTFTSTTLETGSENLYLHGPRGTGKTHLTLASLENLPGTTNTAYLRSTKNQTQYKALQQIYQSITDETIDTGHHTAELKRRIDEKTQAVNAVVVLDEIDFLLQNDGDDLLYYLSRTKGISIVLISPNQNLKNRVEERTLSSLQPQYLKFDPLNEKQNYQILYRRAQDSLKPQSLHKAALTYIVSHTSNIAFSLHWLKTAVENTSHLISEKIVRQSREQALQNYARELLQDFTSHHQLLYNIILQLTQQNNKETQSGEIYQQYQNQCQNRSIKPLSNRRISTYLKHLELLNLINAEYRYGGRTGKTRKIRLEKPFSTNRKTSS